MTFDDVKSFVSNRINNAPDPPQEYIPLGWGSYHMGAFTTEGQPNDALKQLWKR